MRMERDEVIRRLKEIAFHNDDHTDNLALAALEWIEEYRRQAELYADNIQRTMEVRDEYKRQLDAMRAERGAAMAERDGLVKVAEQLLIVFESMAKKEMTLGDWDWSYLASVLRAAIAKTNPQEPRP